MTDVLTPSDAFGEALAAFRETAGGPDWLARFRDEGARQFAALGFPTLKDEPWRFTDIRPITRESFVLAEAGRSVDAAALASYRLGDAAGLKLVFVDGHYREDLSDLSQAAAGVRVQPLSEAVREQGDLVREHLGEYAAIHDGFDALNAAFAAEGAFVHIAAGVKLEQPIELLFVASGGEQPVMSHGRNLIVAEAGASATIVETWAGPFGGTYLTNAVTEVAVGVEAEVSHYFVERESVSAYNLSSLRVRQQERSRFESHTALFGGALVRNNIIVELAGEECDSTINGLYIGHGSQHLDNYMRVIHAAPNCESRQFYKGVLDDQSHGVFCGRIVVNEGAQQTDAKQTNRSMLLSDDATADAMPQLEIYADDVKCTHGATTGQIDEDALFYLQSRGVDEHTARSLLIYAFAEESLQRMSGVQPVRDELEILLLNRLPESQRLKTVVQ